MSPIELEILLNYRWNPYDFRAGDFSAPAVRESIDSFQKNDMLEVDTERRTRQYKLTARGEFFIDYLCSLPIPSDMHRFEIATPEPPK